MRKMKRKMREEDNITNMILEDTGKPQKFIILLDF